MRLALPLELQTELLLELGLYAHEEQLRPLLSELETSVTAAQEARSPAEPRNRREWPVLRGKRLQEP